MGNYWRQGEHWGDAEYGDAKPNEAQLARMREEILRRAAVDEAGRKLLNRIHLARELGFLLKVVVVVGAFLLLIWWWPW